MSLIARRFTLAAIAALTASAAPAQAQSTATSTTATTATTTETAAVDVPAVPAWVSRLTFGGDIRVRLDRQFDGASPSKENDRPRLRARFSVLGKVNDDVSIGMRLRTGGTGLGTAGSSNQTLSDFGGIMTWGLDLGYIDYRPTTELALQIGKVPHGYWTPNKNEIIYNSNYNPEGLQLRYQADMETIKPYVLAGYHHLYDRQTQSGTNLTTTGVDVSLVNAQIGVPYKFEAVSGVLAVGYSSFNNIKGFPAILGTPPNTTTFIASSGNTIDAATGLFANDYKVLDVGTEVGVSIMDLPLVAFGEYIKNMDISDENMGYLGGLKIGSLKKPGDLQFVYSYRDIDADAILTAIAESTFLNGGTDVFGSTVSLGTQLAESTTLGFTYDFGQKQGRTYEDYRLELVASF